MRKHYPSYYRGGFIGTGLRTLNTYTIEDTGFSEMFRLTVGPGTLL